MNKQIANSIAEILKHQLTAQDVEQLLEKPKSLEVGDVAFPCFTLAKLWKKPPQQIA
ncbi:MAG TPA: arginine--tRNA ligase, partial [Lysinibacillus sp.]|nr:arginine--tRNA ligase [Lysinibacillus sp.]